MRGWRNCRRSLLTGLRHTTAPAQRFLRSQKSVWKSFLFSCFVYFYPVTFVFVFLSLFPFTIHKRAEVPVRFVDLKRAEVPVRFVDLKRAEVPVRFVDLKRAEVPELSVCLRDCETIRVIRDLPKSRCCRHRVLRELPVSSSIPLQYGSGRCLVLSDEYRFPG